MAAFVLIASTGCVGPSASSEGDADSRVGQGEERTCGGVLCSGAQRDAGANDGTAADGTVGPCADAPCENDATCIGNNGAFRCECTPGYEGILCEVNADDCATSPCRNGATCVDELNGYSCTCLDGYAGADCEVNVDDCVGEPCQNGGRCVDEVGSYRCECAPGYEGAHCETNPDDCLDAPCENGGTCVDGLAAYSCICREGFEGARCETDVDDCAARPCENGGVCEDEVAGYLCHCPVGTSGPRCEINADDCVDHACQNGATCLDGINEYQCECAAGYEGVLCDIDIDDCAAGPCQMGAECLDGVDSFTCECAEGYTACNEDCALLASDRAHCGACGRSCGGQCREGVCMEAVEVCGGSNHSCALMRYGEVFCWGGNARGVLGVDPAAVESTIVPVRAAAVSGASALACQGDSTCVISGGSFQCWGALGNGFEPVALAGWATAVSLQGRRRMCVTFDDRTNLCVTDYEFDGSVDEAGEGLVHTCARSGASVYCWGGNGSGQLGSGVVGGSSDEPVRVDLPSSARKLVVGESHNCVLAADSSIYCWGNDSSGQLGAAGGISTGDPVRVGGNLVGWAGAFSDVATGEYYSCGALHDGRAACWGQGGYGQLGDGGHTGRRRPGYVRYEPYPDGQLRYVTGVTGIGLGRYHGCAVLGSGGVACWGRNTWGQLGAETPEDPSTAVRVRFGP